MNIALMNEKITIQKSQVVTDTIGNHKKAWVPFYSCAATVGGESGREKEAAAVTEDKFDISFTIRSCKLANAVTSDGYRILFRDDAFNIISVDHMNFKHKSIKFRCRKEGKA